MTFVPSAGPNVVVLVIPKLASQNQGCPRKSVVGSRAMVAVGDVPQKDHGQVFMDIIASDAVLDEPYAWLCDRRKDDSPHDDIWNG